MGAVKTETVRRQLIGDGRKALKDAAGSNGVISKAEQKKLPKDMQQAVKGARKPGAPVKVDDAVDAYASTVSEALKAVDKRAKGTLSNAEASRVAEPALRARVLDTRTQLAGKTSNSGTPGPVNRGALDNALEDLQSTWGDENIMDGAVGMQSTVVAGRNAKDTALRNMQDLASSGDVDALVGKARVDGPRALKKADVDAMARAVNDDGFQYASTDELARIRGEVANIIKKLGGPTGLEVAVVRQNAKCLHLSDTDTFPAQVWVVRNPQTEDAVSLMVRKGSL
jgi:hypothetical protein